MKKGFDIWNMPSLEEMRESNFRSGVSVAAWDCIGECHQCTDCVLNCRDCYQCNDCSDCIWECDCDGSSDCGGGCFITTATTRSRNLPDDCHELTTLRKFRDTFMKTNPIMNEEVLEYYEIAPKICSKIDKLSNANEIYEDIYQKWLKNAVQAVDENKNDKAYKIYKEMFLTLKENYLK